MPGFPGRFLFLLLAQEVAGFELGFGFGWLIFELGFFGSWMKVKPPLMEQESPSLDIIFFLEAQKFGVKWKMKKLSSAQLSSTQFQEKPNDFLKTAISQEKHIVHNFTCSTWFSSSLI